MFFRWRQCFLNHLNDRNLYTSTITRVLGSGNGYQNIIASSAFALVSFFYIFTISSHFKVSTFILVNRVIYVEIFDKYVISQYFDHILIIVGAIIWFVLAIRGNGRFHISLIYVGLTIVGVLFENDILIDVIALSSLPVVVLLIIYNRLTRRKKILYADSHLVLNYLAIIGAITGIVAIVFSLEPLLSFPLSASLHIHNYAYEIFVLFSTLSSVMMFLMIFCFPVKLIANECIDKIKKYKNNRHTNNKTTTTTTTTTTSVSFIPAKAVKLRTKIVCLTIFVVLSIFLVIIPHLPTINKDNQQIGVDSKLYVNWVGNLTNTYSAQEFLHEAFNLQAEGSRPLALIFLFAIMKMIGTVDPFFIFEYVPIILGPALVLTTYFLSRELTSNDVTSLFASFLTAVSFQMLIGIYAGFYANWLALICGYLASMFLIRFLKVPSKFNYAVFSILMILLVLIHVFTWSTFVIVFFVFIVAMLILKRYPRRNAVLLLLVVISTVVLDVARTTFTGSTGGVIQNLNIPGTGIGSEEFSKHWNTLIETVHIHVGGLFSNFIILGLCLYWLFFSKMRRTSDIFIIIFMSVGILPLFFGDWIIQTRILYNIPFQIPAAIALARISNRGHVFRVFLPAIVIWLVAMSVTSVSNFYQIPPS
jgi:hypothetical protein